MILYFENFAFLAEPNFLISSAIIAILTVYAFKNLGLYNSLLQFVSTEVVKLVSIGSVLSFLLLNLVKITYASFMPWQVPIIYAAFLFIGINSLRFIIRELLRTNINGQIKNIAIYGAGEAGAQVIQSLSSKKDYKVKLLIDDDKNIQGSRLFGHKVMSISDASNKFDELDIRTVLLAMPSISISKKKKIVSNLLEFSLAVKSVPSIGSIIDGSENIDELKSLTIEDLLGREVVEPFPDLLKKNISGKTVIVTGAGGSIGSELCRQILKLDPVHIILIDVSEFALFNITQELDPITLNPGVKVSTYVGSVCDRPFIRSILDCNNVQTIYHAAAYKHVPLMEHNVEQAIKNNSLGTFVIAEEAVRTKVSNFTLISTDKAVNPTNIMGASKRLAERICLSMNAEQKVTRFSIVRFGNVLGSSGSVVPLFKKQIAAGGPITITHPEVTRYFMTIGEAVQLVIQASAMSKDGEVFVLDMEKPVKIMDLALQMVQLSGLNAYIENNEKGENGDIAIRITGLRPGEKMYEELSYGDNLTGTFHPRIMTAQEAPMLLDQMKVLTAAIERLIQANDTIRLIETLEIYADYIANVTQMSKILEPRSKSLPGEIIFNPSKNIRT
jgi:FlaA1/EpsC-like NDP-sugar epimerase